MVDLADCASSRARAYGLTAEIHSTPDYTVTQAWAARLSEAGFGGMRYFLRHDPGQHLVGIALFGPAGVPHWAAAGGETGEVIAPSTLAEVEHRFGIRVVPTP